MKERLNSPGRTPAPARLRTGAGSSLAALLVAAGPCGAAGPPLSINEVDADTPGVDVAEFVELYDGGRGGTALDGLVLVLFNGTGDVSYDAIDLDGGVTGVSGFFVIGSDEVPNVDLVEFSSNGIQNGPDAVALYQGDAADFPNGTAPTLDGLVDVVVYGSDAGLLRAFGASEAPEDGPNDSISRLPDGTGGFTLLPPTPGLFNSEDLLGVDKEGPTVGTAGGTITYQIFLVNTSDVDAANVTVVDTLPAGLTFVDQTVTPPGGLTLDDATEPTIGWSTPSLASGKGIEIELTVMVDPRLEGKILNTVDVATTTPGDDPANNTSTVDTEIAPMTGVVINEILADPPLTGGDANGDGSVSPSSDEFVEIVNVTGGDLDMSGWTLSDASGDAAGQPKHVFPGGTMIPDQCAVVVFGGGIAIGEFGNATVQIATDGPLGLNNGGDTVIVRDSQGNLVSGYNYGEEAGEDESITRDPDVTGPVLIGHSAAAGAEGAIFSPGTRVDGERFEGCPGPVDPPKNLRINEIRVDQLNSGDPDEYFELKGDPGTSLDGISYVVLGDGTRDLDSGVVERVIDLSGHTIAADGLFLTVETTFLIAPIFIADLVLPGGELFEDDDNVTHLLVANFIGAEGQDLDSDDDGLLDFSINPDLAAPWSHVVDAIGLVKEANPPRSTEFTYAAALGHDTVGPDQGDAPAYVYRCEPDGVWLIGPVDKFDGTGTPAAPNPSGCPNAACCLPDGACTDGISKTSCESGMGGVWQGVGSTCAEVVCVLGACCLPDETCLDGASERDCEDVMAGEWQGAGSTCGGGKDPCGGSCPADIDGDGVVDVDDLVAVIFAWETADPDADVDGSGEVNVDDLILVVLGWGACS